MKPWDFQAEVWADLKKQTAWPRKALAVLPPRALRGLPQSRSHLHKECHHFCPAGNVSNNLLPGTQMGKQGADCMLPTFGGTSV